jgi:hypothetical protein
VRARICFGSARLVARPSTMTTPRRNRCK